MVNRPACLSARLHWGSMARFFCQFRVCSCTAPSLTGGQVCHSKFLITLVSSVILRSERRGRPPGTGWLSYTPRYGVVFGRLLRRAGLRWRYSNMHPQGRTVSKSKWRYDGRSVGQSVLIWRPSQTQGQIYFTMRASLSDEKMGLLFNYFIVGCPLCREGGSLIYSYCWASLAQFS
jgi:hypothetical protein